MKLKQLLNEENVLQKVGIKLNVSTINGKPEKKDAPKWAKFLGQTPEGAYHWLSNETPIDNDTSDKYFPDAKRTQFTGFIGKTSKSGLCLCD